MNFRKTKMKSELGRFTYAEHITAFYLFMVYLVMSVAQNI